MKYVGSKSRFKKELVPIIQNIIDVNEITHYYEPFVGGCNMIDDIRCDNRVGNDMHEYLIAMWKELQAGWIPPTTISEEEYQTVKNNRGTYPKHYVGLVGFAASFGAKWFGGYARGFKADKVTPRDIPNEGIRNLMKQIDDVKDVKFICGDYLTITPKNRLNGWLIYCDPPYAGTTGYKDSVEHSQFWDWCSEMGKGNTILVSEYDAPEGWIPMWEKETTTSLKVKKHEKRTEKLWRYVGYKEVDVNE